VAADLGRPLTPGARDAVAVFDFDGTLTRVDSLVPFLVAVSPRRAAVHVPAALARLAMRRSDRDATKLTMIENVLRDEPASRVQRVAHAYVARFVQRMWRADVLERLRAHQRAGHRTIVASATPDVVIDAAAALLGVDDVVCTRLRAPATPGERWRADGPNCRGAAKLHLVLARLGEPRPATVWAYGNLPHDRELLAWADHAVAVQRWQRVPPPDRRSPIRGPT
jgi:phosphatidylglycerophosphatase C